MIWGLLFEMGLSVREASEWEINSTKNVLFFICFFPLLGISVQHLDRSTKCHLGATTAPKPAIYFSNGSHKIKGGTMVEPGSYFPGKVGVIEGDRGWVLTEVP